MPYAKNRLRRAAKQLVETDLVLGGDFMPARRNPLVVPQPSAACGLAGDVQGPQRHSSVVGAAACGFSQLSPEQKAAALNDMDVNEVRPCVKCRLHAGRSRTVFGDGDPSAALMFIGEGPGEEEDRQGRPFVGRAGQLLNQMIAAMGLRREQVYIANVVKCRPPGNRAPLPDESATCTGLYLFRQIQIIHPGAIVTLGNPSTQALLGAVLGITKIRGQWQKLPALAEGIAGIPVMPTFHPAYLLRQYTPDNRKKVWDDLQKVMGLLGIKKK
jgi:DNA polymerase